MFIIKIRTDAIIGPIKGINSKHPCINPASKAYLAPKIYKLINVIIPIKPLIRIWLYNQNVILFLLFSHKSTIYFLYFFGAKNPSKFLNQFLSKEI
jgi:hypothetical protein